MCKHVCVFVCLFVCLFVCCLLMSSCYLCLCLFLLLMLLLLFLLFVVVMLSGCAFCLFERFFLCHVLVSSVVGHFVCSPTSVLPRALTVLFLCLLFACLFSGHSGQGIVTLAPKSPQIKQFCGAWPACTSCVSLVKGTIVLVEV